MSPEWEKIWAKYETSPLIKPNELDELKQVSLLLNQEHQESKVMGQFAWFLGLVDRMIDRADLAELGEK